MPGGYKKITGADGNTFSSTNQPPNNFGRPPRVFSKIAKEFKDRGIERATPEAVREAYEYLLALTLLEVIEIAGAPKDETNDYPVIVRACAQELTGKRQREILNDMLNRAHGTPGNKTDLNVNRSVNVIWHEERTHADEVNQEADDSDN